MSALLLSFPGCRAKSDNEYAADEIRSQLRGYPTSIVEQAIARSNRLIFAGKSWSLASDRAIKWARCALHNNTEPPSAA